MSAVEIQDILQDQIPLLFAADQAPFEVTGTGGVNQFCVLVPLMTRDGRRLGNLQANFPDRGRVWWMLRHDLRSADVRAGTIWTGRIENAVKRDDDAFQVHRPSITMGAKDWIEIIDVPEADPGISRLCSDRGIPLDRQPLKRVIVRGRTFSYGPFLATHRPQDDALELRAVHAGDPTTYRLVTSDLSRAPIETFRFDSSKHDPHSPVRPIQLSLLHERHLDPVLAQGVVVDAQSEAQLIKWALGLANYTNRERQEFRAALDALPPRTGLPDQQVAERLDRFRALCKDAQRVSALGADVAAALAESGPLRQLVTEHVGEIAQTRIDAEIRKAKEQIERQTEQARANKELAEADLRELEEQIEKRRQEADARLRRENEEWLQGMRQRELELDARESELADKESDLEKRLHTVIDDYRNNRDEIARWMLTYAPLMRQLEPPVRAGSSATSASGTRSTALQFPAYIDEPVADSGLDQPAFLDQLRRVVERRGFVFHDDDLLNFHISLLAGMWTVVAGPTGLGKSSLPRLYAEALGMRERYLKVPVQPDWLDDRDVLGAFNSLSERFEPAATGLTQLLVYAERDFAESVGGIYLICLDEMNLSRVEHYFARFLSILEDPMDQRRLTLLSPGVGTDADPFSAHRQISIGPNVRLVGTVNVDETTHFFSPKVLDRSILMTLEEPDLARPAAPTTRVAELVVQPVRCSTWSAWRRSPADADRTHHAMVLELDSDLRRIQSGLGFRLRDRILSFIATAAPLLENDRAVDLAIAQTVLPRLRTHHPQFLEVVEQLLRRLPPERFARCGRFLEAMKASDGSHDFFQLL